MFKRKKTIILAASMLFLLLLLGSLSAQAHPPSQVGLSYDLANQSLTVSVSHQVSDPARHYINRIVISKNSSEILARDYSSQPTVSSFSYDYQINASAGDMISATAYCVIAGSRSAQIRVGEGSLAVMQAPNADAKAPALLLESIVLPPGFKIELFAENLTFARSLCTGPDGEIFVGTRRSFESLDSPEGSDLYAILDENGNDHIEADEVHTIAEGLNNPNGVAYHNGSLYVAEIDRIIRFDDIEAIFAEDAADAAGAADVVAVTVRELPQYILHGWRYMAFGPDGRLYLAMGADCNVCHHEDELNATIVSMNPDGSDLQVYSKGVRNSVGFDWDPETAELWFTDNGRDLLGNDVPSDELNHAPVPGLNFGFPTCHSGSIPDPDLGSDENYSCNEMMPPAWVLGPHVAALGMRFYEGEEFPEEYRHAIFIAEHGSWNRDTPIGYRVVVVRLENGDATGHEVFAEGWLTNGTVWGRPVDVQPLSDGSLLVSDDMNGAIYRISYEGL